jgi:prephenate dehydrogenase
MSSAPSPTEPPFRTVAIVGLGVMGGSLARALAELDSPPTVAGWSPIPEEREAALQAGVVSRAPSEWNDAVADAEIVVLAAPLRATCDLLADVATSAPPAATLSDVASLKGPVASAAAAAGLSDRWVGAHPMTGSEQSGFGASRADLYRGALVWTVAGEAASARVPAVHALWRSLGAAPVAIEPEAHDRLVAKTSHLPQLVSNALATVLAESGITPDQLGPGARDMTRLAASSPEIWRDLFAHRAPELAEGLRSLAGEVERLAILLEEDDLDTVGEIMRATRAWRRP